MTTPDFDFVRSYVRDQAAIVLEPGKEYLVESRLQTLARKEQIASVDELVAQLRAKPNSPLHRKVVDAMTTNETSFFRDIHPFDALRKSILPELLARNGQERKLNFWCGAASTGQEPYSVLMMMAEHFPALLGWDMKFIATDLSREVIARAKAGRYNQLEVNRGLPASLLVKHFTRQGAEWEIREELRKRVDYRELNLIGTWPMKGKFDAIFCRNVVIYFEEATQSKIWSRFVPLMNRDGRLYIETPWKPGKPSRSSIPMSLPLMSRCRI